VWVSPQQDAPDVYRTADTGFPQVIGA